MRSYLKRQKERLERYLSSDVLSYRQLTAILLPVLWEQAFLVVLSLAGIWMLSADGEGALSVVNMMAVITKVFVSVCLGLVTGGTVVVAQNVGAGRRDTAGKCTLQTVALLAGFGVSLGVLLFAFREQLVSYLLSGADAAIVQSATEYFMGFCLSLPFYAFYQGFAGAMRGWGHTRTAWVITFTVNGAELALTAFLLIGRGMGVRGIAAAIFLSRLVGALLAGGIMLRRRGELHLHLRDLLSPDKKLLRAVLIVAVPLSLEQFFFNGGKAMSQRAIAGFGTAHMAANGVVNALFDLINLPQATLREGVVTVAAMCIGFGRPDLARRYVYRFLRIIRRAVLWLAVPTLALSGLLLWSYRLSADANRLTLLCILLIYLFAPFFLGGSFTVPAGLRAGGDAVYVSLAALVSMWGIRVSLSYLFAGALGMGVVGLNLAMVIEWVFRSIAYRERMKGARWYSHKLIEPT